MDGQGDWDLPLPKPPAGELNGFSKEKLLEEGMCEKCGVECPSKRRLREAQCARRQNQPPITPSEAVRLAVLAGCVHGFGEYSSCKSTAERQFKMIEEECSGGNGAMEFYQKARLKIDNATHRHMSTVGEWKRVSKEIDELHAPWYATMEALMKTEHKKGLKELMKKIGAAGTALAFAYQCVKDKVGEIVARFNEPIATTLTFVLTALGAAAAYATTSQILEWGMNVGGKLLAGALIHLGKVHQQITKNVKRRAYARKLRRQLCELYKDMVKLCKEYYPDFSWKKDAREFVKITENGARPLKRLADWFAVRVLHEEVIDRMARRIAKNVDGALNDFEVVDADRIKKAALT